MRVPRNTSNFLRVRLFEDASASAILEFAITLPLLVVFVVGIYDFSGAFNQKQKVQQAAQEGAIVAGAQPTNDIATTNPDSLQPVVAAVFNSLAASGVLPQANQAPCTLPPASPLQAALTSTYTIHSCSSAYPGDDLVIAINRGWVCSPLPACNNAPPFAVGTNVQVTFPYHWRFNSVIQLLFPGPSGYAPVTSITESATVHNQV
jgi:Flp pilus assembly protein TadG